MQLFPAYVPCCSSFLYSRIDLDILAYPLSFLFNRTKTNVQYHGGGPRLLSSCEYLHVAYWSFDGKRTMDHFNTAACSNFSNVLQFPAVLQKLQDPSAQGRIVNHYQKPQKLINHLLDMFSRPGDWVLDAFSGSGTTIACALKKGRNCVAVDIDKEA